MSGTVDLKLEVIAIPVSDVDRAKGFYGGLGWTLDADFMVGKDFRAVQLTPPGSPHMVVLEPGLRVYKIYNGYWFFGRRTVEELRLAPGPKARRRLSIRTEKRRCSCSPNRIDHHYRERGNALPCANTQRRETHGDAAPCRTRPNASRPRRK